MQRMLGKCTNKMCFYHQNLLPIPTLLEQCPLCGNVLSYIESDSTWLQQLANNTDLWHQLKKDVPFYIAYQYDLLKYYCNENKPYAALLCLKDNYEFLLKTELLLAIACIEKCESEETKKTLLPRLTVPNPSLGTWLSLATDINSFLEEHPSPLYQSIPLGEIVRFFITNEVVKWRNERIGHGALQLSEDTEFQYILGKMIRLYTNLLSEVEDSISNQTIIFNANRLNEAYIKKCHTEIENKLYYSYVGSETRIPLNPFFAIHQSDQSNCSLFFFDGQKTLSLSNFQSLLGDGKYWDYDPKLSGLRNDLEKKEIDILSDPNDVYLTEQENREIERIQLTDDFVEPLGIVSLIKDAIKNENNRLILLQMERGTGKSILTDKLNSLFEKPLLIDDNLDVRTYHIERTQITNTNDFYNRIQWLWSHQFNGDSWQRVPSINQYIVEGYTPSEAFCKFLGEAKIYTEHARNKKRILMILDGIDELIEESVWNVIPIKDLIPKDVIILLTSRVINDTDLPETTKKRIVSLKPDCNIIVNRKDPRNKQFLFDYIQAFERDYTIILSESEKKTLVKLSDYRVLYLGLLCRLMSLGLKMEELPNVNLVIQVYLDTLYKFYGKNETHDIVELLTIMSTLGTEEPLSLKEIAAVTSTGRITIGIVGMIRDLATMFKKLHTIDGIKFLLANEDISDELRSIIPNCEDNTIRIIRLAQHEIRQGWPLETPEIEVAAIHMVDMAWKWVRNPERLFSLKEDRELDRFIPSWQPQVRNSYSRNSKIEFLKELVSLRKKIPSALGDAAELDLANALGLLAHAYYEDNQLVEALGHETEAYLKYTFLLGDKHEYTRSAMNGIALIHIGMNYDIDAAIKLLEQSIQISHEIGDYESEGTITTLNSLSLALEKQEKYNEAFHNQEEVVRLANKFYGPNSKHTINMIVTLEHLKEKATKDPVDLNSLKELLKQCIKIYGSQHQVTIRTMISLAVALMEQGHEKESLSIGENAVDICMRSFGTYDDRTLQVIQRYVSLLMGARRYDEGIKYAQIVYDAYLDTLGENHFNTYKAKLLLLRCEEMLHPEKAQERKDYVEKAVAIANNKKNNTPETVVGATGDEFFSTYDFAGDILSFIKDDNLHVFSFMNINNKKEDLSETHVVSDMYLKNEKRSFLYDGNILKHEIKKGINENNVDVAVRNLVKGKEPPPKYLFLNENHSAAIVEMDVSAPTDHAGMNSFLDIKTLIVLISINEQSGKLLSIFNVLTNAKGYKKAKDELIKCYSYVLSLFKTIRVNGISLTIDNVTEEDIFDQLQE